jgi:hypothetical protein
MHNPKLSRSQVFFVQIFSRVKMMGKIAVSISIGFDLVQPASLPKKRQNAYC